MFTFRQLTLDTHFTELCDFIRMDITSSRSFAWQRLNTNGLDVVGFGDSVAEVATSRQPLTNLLETTVSEGVNISAVIAELDRLLRNLAGNFPLDI